MRIVRTQSCLVAGGPNDETTQGEFLERFCEGDLVEVDGTCRGEESCGAEGEPLCDDGAQTAYLTMKSAYKPRRWTYK